jgi:hypothetical protein
MAASFAPSISSADPAVAEALFREGRRLLDEGKTDEACLKLEESQAQDPSSGTLLNLGLCHETQHKIATAWANYVSAARLAREQLRPDRAVVAEKKVADLERRLPYLAVSATAPAPGLQILLGAERLGPGLLGSAVPVDPGSYLVTASAPGRKDWKTTVDIKEGESKAVTVPELEPEAPSAPAVAPPVAEAPARSAGTPAVAPVPPSDALAPPPAPPPVSGNGRAVLGWSLGGAGLAAAGVGAGFGVASLGSYHDASQQCPLRTNCSDSAIAARNSAESKAWVSNIAIGAGVVGVGLGAWFLVSGRRGEPATRVSVQARPEAGGLRVGFEQSF